MTDIVNLNKFRKARRAAEEDKTAAANRAKFGRTKAARRADNEAREKRERLLDGVRREDGETAE